MEMAILAILARIHLFYSLLLPFGPFASPVRVLGEFNVDLGRFWLNTLFYALLRCFHRFCLPGQFIRRV